MISKIKKVYRTVTPFIIRRTVGLCRLYLSDYDTYEKVKCWGEQRKKYGKLNSNKTFYILRKYPIGMGLLSCYLTYLGQLKLVSDKNYIPLVDMKSNYYPMSHNSEQDANRVNAWELYFEQLSEYDLKDVYNSKHVIIGEGFTTSNAMELFDATVLSDELIQKWHNIDKNYMRLNKDLSRLYRAEYESLFGNKRILGVMIREDYSVISQMGMEMIKGHPVQPKLEIVMQDLHRRLGEWNCDYIFIATESIQTLDAMKKRFGDKLLYTNRIRRDTSIKDNNDYGKKSNEYAKSITMLEKNIDYLKEVFLLSNCTCLICGKASGTVVASIWNGNKYEHRHLYELGTY